ncbi:MAG: hypothetical protein AB8G96_03190 [Phycisphaerales bacterium]
MSILAILFLLLFLAFPIVGILLIATGMRGAINVSSPHCVKCSYELREVLIAGSDRCPECGADLEQPKAVSFGRGRRRVPRIVAGFVLVAVFPLLISVMMFASVSARGTMARAAAANAAANTANPVNPTAAKPVVVAPLSPGENEANARDAIDATDLLDAARSTGNPDTDASPANSNPLDRRDEQPDVRPPPGQSSPGD